LSRILIVEDVPALQEQYAYDLKRLGGYEIVTASNGREALDILDRETVDGVLLDLEMPDVDGFEVLKSLKSRGSSVPVIVYTGTGDFDRCVRAVRLGAYSFIDKAEPIERVAREVENALERGRLVREVSELKERLGGEARMVGSSAVLAELRAAIERLAPVPSPVLITGESGSGKEIVARMLHRLGGRGGGPFLAVNSAALPENLVESALFGHERGAFTGADKTRKGAFESASGGTLFLDEIGDLPAAAQAKLLRVLEERAVTRIGSDRAIAIDARIVAATNRDLEAMIEEGRFRRDLYHRLDVHTLRVPSLREHMDDLSELVDHFLADTCARFGMRVKTIAPETIARLAAHSWEKNNVRELRNVVERMVIACDGERIEPEHVPPLAAAAGREEPADGTLQDLKSAAERRIVLAALEKHDWHITHTAETLGLADHSSLLRIMRRHGIKKP